MGRGRAGTEERQGGSSPRTLFVKCPHPRQCRKISMSFKYSEFCYTNYAAKEEVPGID